LSAGDYLDAITRESDELVDAARSCAPDTAVPSCPEWDVAALLEHIGRVHRWAAANAMRAPDAEPWRSRDLDIELPADHAARLVWVRDGASALVDALNRVPDTPAWTFMPPSTVGFWQRRQAQETAVHRFDAQLAAGAPEPLDGALAVDGIDEVLAMIPVRPGATPPTGSGETIHLHATDRDGEWLIALEPDGMRVRRGHEKGDVAARATASELLLLLWGRIEASEIEVFGDASILERFRVATTI
jgi:uncharacterized protein (TIGR03083 family)